MSARLLSRGLRHLEQYCPYTRALVDISEERFLFVLSVLFVSYGSPLPTEASTETFPTAWVSCPLNAPLFPFFQIEATYGGGQDFGEDL